MSRILMAGVATVIGLAMLSSASHAASPKRPYDPDCQKWQLRTMTGNWVNAPDEEYWVCVSGLNAGKQVGMSGAVRGTSGGGSDGGDNGDDETCKPGWGGQKPGKTDQGDKNHEHCGPPGQNKKQ